MGLKIFSSIVSLLVIFFMVFYTFNNNSNGNYDIFSKLTLPQNGIFSLTQDESGTYIEQKAENSCYFCEERFDNLDKIFFSNEKNYTIDETTDENDIKLGKGEYFFSFSFPKKYVITGSGYKMSVVGPINFYVNTEDEKKLFVLSQNNIIQLSLLGMTDNEEKTQVYIYPHMFYNIKLILNSILTNADSYRVSQVENISFIKNDLFSTSLNLTNYSDINTTFLKTVFNYLNYEITKNKSDTNLLLNNYDVKTYDYLKKYFSIFVNKNKKEAYYKDLIYINLLDIFKNGNTNDGVYQDTISYYQKLKELDQDEYINMLEFLYYFKEKFVLENSLGKVNTEDKYDTLLQSILGFKSYTGNNSIYHVFDLYDMGNKTGFFSGISDVLDNYLGENGLEIKDDKLVGYDSSKSLVLGYYTSFIEKIIESFLTNDIDESDIENVFNIFYKYSLISTNTLSDGTDEKKKTMLVLQLDLLEKLGDFIKSYFFTNDDTVSYLVKKKGVNIDSNVYLLLEKGYKNIYNFYTQNKGVFDENVESDFLYMRDLEQIFPDFSDYVSALENYDKYKALETSSTDDSGDSNSGTTIKVYSIHDVISYLLEFDGVEEDYLLVKQGDNQDFNVTIKRNQETLVFDLFPNKNFLINNIYLNENKLNGVYILEKLEKDFFITAFFDNSDYAVDNQISDSSDDSQEILTYKRNTLLGINGEFYSLSGSFDISENNITVNNQNGVVSIKVNNIKTTKTINSNKYGAYMSGDYYIGTNQHYFSNIKLSIFKTTLVNGTYETEDYGIPEGTYISVNGNINIKDITNYIDGILIYYDQVINVYQTLANKYKTIHMSVNSARTIDYSFTYGGKSIEVFLNKVNIVSIKSNGTELLSQSFKYDSLKQKLSLFIK